MQATNRPSEHRYLRFVLDGKALGQSAFRDLGVLREALVVPVPSASGSDGYVELCGGGERASDPIQCPPEKEIAPYTCPTHEDGHRVACFALCSTPERCRVPVPRGVRVYAARSLGNVRRSVFPGGNAVYFVHARLFVEIGRADLRWSVGTFFDDHR